MIKNQQARPHARIKGSPTELELNYAWKYEKTREYCSQKINQKSLNIWIQIPGTTRCQWDLAGRV